MGFSFWNRWDRLAGGHRDFRGRGLIKWRYLAAVLGSNAMTDAPFEVGLGVGLDEGVNGSDDSSLVTTGSVVSAGLSHVLVITTNSDRQS